MPDQLSRPPMVTPFGKCSEPVKTMVPEATWLALLSHATRCGTTPAEVVRNLLLEKFHGSAMVEESLIQQFRSTVRTGPETAGVQ